MPTNIRFRDGSYSNFNNTDLNGYAGFNEVFPLFNWYVVETDSTRYKNTGTHVVYDAGGPADGHLHAATADRPSGLRNSNDRAILANTDEAILVPADSARPGRGLLRPMRTAPVSRLPMGPVRSGLEQALHRPHRSALGRRKAGRASPARTASSSSARSPSPGENGGIHGHVVYASTRPFDDPALLLQLSWEPLVPHVTINLYRRVRRRMAPDP